MSAQACKASRVSSNDFVFEQRDFSRGLDLRGNPQSVYHAQGGIEPGYTDFICDVEVLGGGKLRPRARLDNVRQIRFLRDAADAENVVQPAWFHTPLRIASPNSGQSDSIGRTSFVTTRLYTQDESRFLIVGGTSPRLTATHWNDMRHSDWVIGWGVPEPWAGSGRVSYASVAGNLYVCVPGQKMIKYRWPNFATATGPTRVQMRDPADTARTYRAPLLKLDAAGTAWEADTITSSSSWSDDYDSPFADVYHADQYFSSDGRFPVSDVILGVNAGGSEFVFSARGSVVRWSHPLAHRDSAHCGLAGGGTDAGPDWPRSASETLADADEPPVDPAAQAPSGGTLPSLGSFYEAGRYARRENAKLRLYGPEDWSRHDFLHVHPDDGDQITAMLHHFDTILVFKTRSMSALTGSLPGALSLLPISDHIGCVNNDACISTPHGVFFFAYPHGVMRWTQGGSIENVSEMLGTWEARFDEDDFEGVTLGYRGGKLFLGVPWQDRGVGGRIGPFQTTYVLDVSSGAWIEWQVPAVNFTTVNIPGLADEMLITVASDFRSDDDPPVRRTSSGFCKIADTDTPLTKDTIDNWPGRSSTTDTFEQDYRATVRMCDVRDREQGDAVVRFRSGYIEVSNEGRYSSLPPVEPFVPSLPNVQVTVNQTSFSARGDMRPAGRPDLNPPLPAVPELAIQRQEGVQHLPFDIELRGRRLDVLLQWVNRDVILDGIGVIFWRLSRRLRRE